MHLDDFPFFDVSQIALIVVSTKEGCKGQTTN